MFPAIAGKLNLENIRDIPLPPCGTLRYSTEIAEAFITVQVFISFSLILKGFNIGQEMHT